MEKEQIRQLITKYKDGLCNEREIEILQQWIDDQGAGKPDYLFQSAGHENMLKENMRDSIKSQLFTEKKEKKYGQLMQWLKIAAMLVLVTTAGYLAWNKYVHQQTVQYISIYTPVGQLKTITLPDGSTVYLNADTRITFSDHFNKGEDRKVTLTGEAYFEVVHDAKRPFFIYTGKLRTQVLGTSFNVKAYHNEPKITVAVTSGKVGVVTGKLTAILTPNQIVDYDNQKDDLVKRDIDDASSLRAWTNEELVFRNQTLNEIARTLIRRYNTRIIIQNDRIAGSILNARFDKNESLENIVGVLATYVGARYKHEGAAYLIK